MDDQVIKSPLLEVKKGSSLLLAPLGIIVPDDCPLPVLDWGWESIVRIFSGIELPVILKADAEQAEMIYRLASFHDVALKTVTGMPGDYPSFWSISFSAYPKIDYSELILAKGDSKAHGGDGIQKSKLPEDEMKGLDPRQQTKIEDLASSQWSGDLEG